RLKRCRRLPVLELIYCRLAQIPLVKQEDGCSVFQPYSMRFIVAKGQPNARKTRRRNAEGFTAASVIARGRPPSVGRGGGGRLRHALLELLFGHVVLPGWDDVDVVVGRVA